MCFHSRTPLIFNMGQKPKGSTELKVYYELTFVTLGHLQELVWSFTFFSTSDPISAHILNILHWFFNRKMPLGVLKSIESLLYHWGSIEELNWSLHGSSSVCSWKTPFQSKCDNLLPQQHLCIHCSMCTVKILMNWGNFMSSYDLSKIRVNCTH